MESITVLFGNKPHNDCLFDDFWPIPAELKTLQWTCLALTLVYTLCLVIATYNIYEYLIKGQRWRIKLMSIFYVIVLALITSRIACLIFFILFFQGDCQMKAIGDMLDNIATYLKAILGVQQLVSMLELSIHIKY